MAHYAGILDGGGKAWGARIPDLPGCYGGGASPEAAIADARDWIGHRQTKGVSSFGKGKGRCPPFCPPFPCGYYGTAADRARARSE